MSITDMYNIDHMSYNKYQTKPADFQTQSPKLICTIEFKFIQQDPALAVAGRQSG